MSLIEARRSEEKERRRGEIIDAAEAVFVEQGFDDATMDQVARAARLSRALIYVYFKDKEALYFAICERALLLLRERFEAVLAKHRRGFDQVAQLGRAYVAFAQAHPCYFAALSRFESHQPANLAPDSVELKVLDAGRAVHAVTVRALEHGVADGSLRADLGPLMRVALTLWACTHGIVQITQTKAELIEEEAVSPGDLVDYAIDLVMRGLAPTPAAARR